ncbi:hypothetical protein [Streptosporangium subroseum]|uniref:hypothetical protein n=1 Tax=Streptosporangium subroseum TaxID=106412 RepID=UPI0015C5EBF5|nr:hypothetical protein [Streptosporangium subroseum]
MFEIVSAPVPPPVVGGASVAGIVRPVRGETHAETAERTERKSAGDGSLPE